jgi:death on curing protein
LKEILAVHDTALTKGGISGTRDLGAIEAAIARPYSGYYRSIAGKAAALIHSLTLNHEKIRNEEMEEMIVAVVEHRMSFDALVAWFTARIVRIDR